VQFLTNCATTMISRTELHTLSGLNVSKQWKPEQALLAPGSWGFQNF